MQYMAPNAQSPGGYQVATYGPLKLLSFWDPLRGDPRFEKIVASIHDSLVFPFFDLDQPVKRFAIVVLSLGREKKTLGFRMRADELA